MPSLTRRRQQRALRDAESRGQGTRRILRTGRSRAFTVQAVIRMFMLTPNNPLSECSKPGCCLSLHTVRNELRCRAPTEERVQEKVSGGACVPLPPGSAQPQAGDGRSGHVAGDPVSAAKATTNRASLRSRRTVTPFLI
ncbi:unnamed protein product [Rangifer tarandus platyrhynchus]|uniref:Uncharacterized protein n=1 Tax=Rangifer tarandus platyrhynchus TaxID=3082113 RepID=A0AC59ZKV8_RANTA